MNTIIEPTIELGTHDVQPTVKPSWHAGIGMPVNASAQVAELRVVVPGVASEQDTCALVPGPIDGPSNNPSNNPINGSAQHDAGTVAFAETPAWSPPI